MSKFIALEGIDGAGKTNLALFICEELRQQGFKVVHTREPGGTELAEQTRAMFLTNPEMSFKTQLLLINAGRNDHMEKVVRPALNSKAVVVSERSVLSCYAYQVHKKIDEQDFDNIVSIIGQDVIPFKTFYIRIKYETSQSRINNRAGAKDVIEQKPKEFFDNLIDGFEYLYHSELGSDFILIDGELPLEKVKDQIRSELIKLIPYL